MPRYTSGQKRQEESRRLRELRKLLGFSQRELAREFSVALGAISQWESGERSIPGPVLKLIGIYERNLGIHSAPPTEGFTSLHSSWASRVFKTTTTSTRIASKLVGSSLQTLLAGHERAAQIKEATKNEIAHQLTESLGEMKGLLMKYGQMISYVDLGLPEPAKKILQTLQDTVQPMSPETAEGVFVAELRQKPRDLFQEWSPAPFAAASIGQVHRARLKSGEAVAVKIQYPEIRQAIEADLKNSVIVDKFSSIFLRNQDKGAILEELRERLFEECDYLHEAANQELFRGIFAGDERIRIPRAYRELSSARVLVSSYVDGLSFARFRAKASQEEKSQAGRTIYRMALESTFRHGLFNCDPHPGNYLFRGDQVHFLDFGCVKRFSPEFLRIWKAKIRAVLEGRQGEMRDLAIEMRLVINPDQYDFDHHYRMLRELYSPWMAGSFTFTHAFVKETWRGMLADNPNKFRMNVPKDWVFINRMQWGLYAVLAELEAKGDWRDIVLPLIES